jgi:uncharacterized protein YbjT (DUF2867 family)
MFGSSVEIIEGDLLKAKDLKPLVKDITHLFAAHGADSYSGKRGYELIDFGGMDKALESIHAEQKTHIIYMSSSLNVKPKNKVSGPFDQLLYWKRLSERMVQESGFPYTIVRSGNLNNNKGGKLQILAEQSGWGDGNITREDVAELLVQTMFSESAKGKVFEIFNREGAPVKDWENFFCELQTGVGEEFF